MTQREAKQLVCGALAAIIDGHRASGAEYLNYQDNGEDYTEADRERLDQAACELMRELKRRANR